MGLSLILRWHGKRLCARMGWFCFKKTSKWSLTTPRDCKIWRETSNFSKRPRMRSRISDQTPLSLDKGSNISLDERFLSFSRRVSPSLDPLSSIIGSGNSTFIGVSGALRSEEHTSELQSLRHLVC